MKDAFVYSGGSALGAFHAGAKTKLAEVGIGISDTDVEIGVSTGAIMAALCAQNKLATVNDMYLNKIKSYKDIFTKFSLPSIAYRTFVEKRKGIYIRDQLNDLIRGNVKMEDVKKALYLGLTSMYDANFHALRHTILKDTNALINAVIASASQPIVWEPVYEIALADGTVLYDNVDGGLRVQTPLSSVFAESPDRIFIFQCHTGEMSKRRMGSLFDIASRTLDILVNTIFLKDVDQTLDINDYVAQCKEHGFDLINKRKNKVLQHYEAIVIKPPYDLGDSMNFDASENKRRWKVGYDTAAKTLIDLGIKSSSGGAIAF